MEVVRLHGNVGVSLRGGLVDTNRLCARRGLGWRWLFFVQRPCSRLGRPIVIEIPMAIYSTPTRERYPFPISSREPFCRLGRVSLDLSLDIVGVGIALRFVSGPLLASGMPRAR